MQHIGVTSVTSSSLGVLFLKSYVGPILSVDGLVEWNDPRGEMPTDVQSSVIGDTSGFVVANDEVSLSLIPRGARLQRLDVDGVRIGHGYDDAADYLSDTTFTGAVVGRFANRIAGGRFILDGVEHQVPCNDRGNALHGGPDGFFAREWTGRAVDGGVEFALVSPDAEMGFPGRVTATARYLLQDRTVTVELVATTDAPTVVNLAQHTYFNLAGIESGTVLGHRLSVAADRVLEVDSTGIPLPGVAGLDGHRLDLRAGPELCQVDDGRIDHCFWLSRGADSPAAELSDPASGRRMWVHTDAPGLQVYTGEHLPQPFNAVALEAQWLPDSPNRADFPSTVLRPGEVWSSVTTWTFA